MKTIDFGLLAVPPMSVKRSSVPSRQTTEPQDLTSTADHHSPRRDHAAASKKLVELVELGGTLVEPYLRAAPDHPGAYLG